MKYLDSKGFSVPMPGAKAAKQWPRCGARRLLGGVAPVECELEMGHTGCHKGIACHADTQYNVEWG
jgi:hypothetical protein